jgi:uncharacterized membrane protein HdeD (DUF308 family)
MFVQEQKWTFYLLKGLIALAFGIVLMAQPKLAVGTFLVLFAAWAVISGLIGIIVSLMTREPGWGWRLAGSIITLVIGIIVVMEPVGATKTILVLVAIYAIVTGLVEIVVGLTAGVTAGTKALLAIIGLIAVAFGVWLLVDMKSAVKDVLWIIGLFALLNGVFTIVLSLFVRSEQKKDGQGGEPLTPVAA